ncbi:MAG: PTS system mannose/fructose/N-acetylgalactosamine-transporter subunit IIB [Vagococcus sp.]
MNIIGARIDSRLVHGQVANLWIPKLQIERVIVVDDSISESDIEKSGLRLATPTGVKLSVLPIERAINQLKDDRYGNQRLLFVLKSPAIYLKLVEAGIPIKEINVGNMAKTEGSLKVTNSINVVESDIQDFEAITKLGTKVISQMVPGVKEEDFMTLLDKAKEGGK